MRKVTINADHYFNEKETLQMMVFMIQSFETRLLGDISILLSDIKTNLWII